MVRRQGRAAFGRGPGRKVQPGCAGRELRRGPRCREACQLATDRGSFLSSSSCGSGYFPCKRSCNLQVSHRLVGRHRRRKPRRKNTATGFLITAPRGSHRFQRVWAVAPLGRRDAPAGRSYGPVGIAVMDWGDASSRVGVGDAAFSSATLRIDAAEARACPSLRVIRGCGIWSCTLPASGRACSRHPRLDRCKKEWIARHKAGQTI